MEILKIKTNVREELLNITPLIRTAIHKNNWQNGAAHLFCMHTTCGLTINESADPDVRADLMRFFNEIAPHKHDWLHSEGNSDAHIRSSVLGASLLIPLENGDLTLGTWQNIYLYEGDGPRTRSILLQLLR